MTRGWAAMWDQLEVRDRVGDVEGLLADLESCQESPAGAAGAAAVHALVDLYGQALTRIMRRLDQWDPELPKALAEDELVGHLLVVHDLHPMDVPARVRAVLEAMNTPQTSIELLAVEEDRARVRVTGGGCGSSADDVRSAVETAVRAAAPEVATVEVEVAAGSTTFVPLDSLRVR